MSKYIFKCPHCGGDTLMLIESVLTTTYIPTVAKSYYGFEVDSFGESEQLDTLDKHGYECNKCYTRWSCLDAVGAEGGFVPVEKEAKDEHQ